MLELETSSPLASTGVEHFLDTVLHTARLLGPREIAMAYPCDIASLQTCVALSKEGIASLTLVGPTDRMSELARVHSIDLSRFCLVDSGPNAADAADMTCKLASAGEVDMVMKGSLHTDELMRAVVTRANGLRTAGRISHAFILQMPGRPQPLIISDCVVNVAPTLPEKVEILEHAIRLAHALDLRKPRVAVLSFTESVLANAQSTLDAAAITKMAERGQITGAVVDGPLAFDNAVSLASANSKGIESRVAGNAEILLMPNLETGNALYKSLVYMANALCAGVLLGTHKPVILTSRTDSMASKVFSAALGSLMLRAPG